MDDRWTIDLRRVLTSNNISLDTVKEQKVNRVDLFRIKTNYTFLKMIEMNGMEDYDHTDGIFDLSQFSPEVQKAFVFMLGKLKEAQTIDSKTVQIMSNEHNDIFIMFAPYDRIEKFNESMSASEAKVEKKPRKRKPKD